MAEHCAAAERCAAFDRRERLAADPEGPGPLCDPCVAAGERAVSALVLDYRDLEQLIPKSVSEWSDGQPGQGKGEAPVPLRLDVEALQREIWWVLTAWEEVVRERDQLSDPALTVAAHPSARPPAVVNGAEVQRAATVLAPRVRLLAVLPAREFWAYPPSEGWSEVAGAQGVLDLIWLHQLARTKLGITKLERELPGECPECGKGSFENRVLRVGNGSDTVHCVRCNHRRPYGDYERYLRMLVWDGAA